MVFKGLFKKFKSIKNEKNSQNITENDFIEINNENKVNYQTEYHETLYSSESSNNISDLNRFSRTKISSRKKFKNFKKNKDRN